MPGEGREGYSSNQICDATGLRRTTLEAWVLRRYLPLSSGPGTGRERKFTLDEAIMIAIAVELTRLGLSVGVAAHSAHYLTRLAAAGKQAPILDGGWVLVLGQAPRSKPVEIEAPGLTPLVVFRPSSPEKLQQVIKKEFGDPSAVVIAAVSKIARNTAKQLGAVIPEKKGRPKSR